MTPTDCLLVVLHYLPAAASLLIFCGIAFLVLTPWVEMLGGEYRDWKERKDLAEVIRRSQDTIDDFEVRR